MTKEIDRQMILKFKEKLSRRIKLITGAVMVFGIVLTDTFLFDKNMKELMLEDEEEEFWKQNPQPKYLLPVLVPSIKNPGQMRKTWYQRNLQVVS